MLRRLARPATSVPELQRGGVFGTRAFPGDENLWNADPGPLGWVSRMKRVLPGSVAASAILIVAGSIWPAHAQNAPLPKPRATASRAPGTTASEPAAATYNWTGAYFGFNAGAALGTFDTSKTTTPSPTYLSDPGRIAAVNAAGQQQIKQPGFTGGVQAGYNWQFGRALLGIEADLQLPAHGWRDHQRRGPVSGEHRVHRSARRQADSISSSSIPMPMPTGC